MATTTNTISTAGTVKTQSPRQPYPITPPLSRAATSEQALVGSKSEHPYSKLRVPEPLADHASDPAGRVDDIRHYNFVFFRGKPNKDWRSLPILPDDDEDMDEPLTPLPSTSVTNAEAEDECLSTPLDLIKEERNPEPGAEATKAESEKRACTILRQAFKRWKGKAAFRLL